MMKYLTRSTWLQIWILTLVVGTQISCGRNFNLFTDFSDKTTNEARFFAAQELVNQRNYLAAITELTALSPDFQDRREVRTLRASAHAGVCGLEFLPFLDTLKALGTQRLFLALMSGFRADSEVQWQNCQLAIEQLQGISAGGLVRDLDENLLLLFVSLAKVGSLLNLSADLDSDGLVDAGFNPCNDGDFPEASVRQLGTGLTLFVSTLASIGTNPSFGDGVLGDLTSLINNVTSVYDFCGAGSDGQCQNSSTEDFSALEVRAFRTFVNESSLIGLGSCTGDFVACACL